MSSGGRNFSSVFSSTIGWLKKSNTGIGAGTKSGQGGDKEGPGLGS